MSPPNDEADGERSPYQRATDDQLRTLNRRQQTLTDRVDELNARISRLETLMTTLVHEVAEDHDHSVDGILADLADETDLPDAGTAPDQQPEDRDDDEDDHTRYL